MERRSTDMTQKKSSTEILRKVIVALENPKYDWRTLEGIVKELRLPLETVKAAIANLDDIVIRTSAPNASGHVLYTTRQHYYKKRGFFTRSLTAASGSIKP
ncbi:MAG: hypothetical protein P4L35_03110 [Ignavibacteriaceae bacterium]|nr:hypothetical protein [Ignavibacteriaceae bacterium]